MNSRSSVLTNGTVNVSHPAPIPTPKLALSTASPFASTHEPNKLCVKAVVKTGGSDVKTVVTVVTWSAATTVPKSVSVGVGTHAIDDDEAEGREYWRKPATTGHSCCSCPRRQIATRRQPLTRPSQRVVYFTAAQFANSPRSFQPSTRRTMTMKDGRGFGELRRRSEVDQDIAVDVTKMWQTGNTGSHFTEVRFMPLGQSLLKAGARSHRYGHTLVTSHRIETS